MREIVSPLSGIRSPFGQRRGGFSPLSLFASGEEGTWLDTSDISTLFQDSAGTTPVTASGQTIGFVKDKSGNELNATQATTAARPSYIVDADGAFIQHDPVDDALTVTFPDLGTEATVAYVTRSEVRLLEDQTISGSYTLPAQELANFVVIDRALTFAEKVNLIRYLAGKVEGVNYGAEIDRLTLIAVNAVDVFVYDTSRDSDGGAWATDYPAQMVIVAEATAVKIYDATDPGLPLHTTLDFTGYTVTALTAVSGVMAVATTTGLATFNLADGDTTVALDYTTSTTPAIVDNAVNDVAMTVLPDAPTDPATGLPVPTIAVATDGGVSVIADDGSAYYSAKTTAATDATIDGERLRTAFTDSDVLAYDISAIAADGFTGDIYDPATTPALLGATTSLAETASGSTLGMTLLAEDAATPANSMIARVTSSYNSGWQNGDIKGAFLADTDDTDLVGSGELVTNGTFDTDVSGWTASGGTLSVVSGKLRLTSISGTVYARQSFSVTSGLVYNLTVDVSNITAAKAQVWASSAGYTAADLALVDSLTTDQTVNVTFTATTGTVYLELLSNATTGQGVDFDNVSVKLADADRSVNSKGLIVNGTITRSPVADGAELVGYSGFSDVNYLEASLKGYLPAGSSSSLCLMGWFKTNSSSSVIAVGIDIPDVFSGGANGFGLTKGWSGYWAERATNVGYTSTPVTSNEWQFLVLVREPSGTKIYSNGVLTGSTGAVYPTSENPVLRIGNALDGSGFFNGAIALVRISATAPTADQIAKIYEDEKVLFQENAACTLYGASDAVTALAHDPDTGLLHVGTSAGRSIFEGLRRVGNTTTSVSTAISASGGLVVEK